LKKATPLLCYGISLIVYTAVLLWGILGEFRDYGSYIGYGVISFYFILPITSFASAMILALRDTYMKWLYPFTFSIFGIAIPLLITPVLLPNVWFTCVLPAFFGLGTGLFIKKLRSPTGSTGDNKSYENIMAAPNQQKEEKAKFNFSGFLPRVLSFFIVNTAFVALIIAINPFTNPVHQLLAFCLTTIITIFIAYMLYRLKEQRIWYVPISQVVMCFGCCIFFFLRDMLGYRKSGGFLDFGVGFEIIVTIYISAFLIIPSLVAAIVYARVMKKANDSGSIDLTTTKEHNDLLQRMVIVCCMAASIVLMALPYGVRMSFASPGGYPNVLHRSYFSGLPIGYANWFPIITAVLSIAVTIILIIGIIRNTSDGKKYGKAVFVCLCACITASLLSWILFSTISVVGVIVFLLHAAAVILEVRCKRFTAR